jgi:hypothetical protein
MASAAWLTTGTTTVLEATAVVGLRCMVFVPSVSVDAAFSGVFGVELVMLFFM